MSISMLQQWPHHHRACMQLLIYGLYQTQTASSQTIGETFVAKEGSRGKTLEQRRFAKYRTREYAIDNDPVSRSTTARMHAVLTTFSHSATNRSWGSVEQAFTRCSPFCHPAFLATGKDKATAQTLLRELGIGFP